MLDWIVNTVTALNYWGIALLMFVENLFPPIPSEVIMPLAGFVVTQGRLRLVYVLIAGIIGSLAGAIFWYIIGERLGKRRLQRFADRHGKWLTLSSADIERSTYWFHEHGRRAVLIGRLVPGIRTFISIPAGITNMHFGQFLIYSTIGTALWVTILTILGYILGQNYQLVERFLSPVSIIIVAGLIVAFVSWSVRRKRRQS